MAKVNVLRSRDKVAVSKLKRDIMAQPDSFFSDFKEWFPNEKVFCDIDTETAFYNTDNQIFVLKFLEKPESLDSFIEDFVQIQENWSRYCKKTGTFEVIGGFILVAPHFPEAFIRKISFLKSPQFQLLKVQGLFDAQGNFSYFLQWESLDPTQEPEGQAALRSEKETIKEPAQETQDSEISLSLKVDPEAVLEETFPLDESADFFIRGQLNAEEELDFEKLNKKILTAAKSETKT